MTPAEAADQQARRKLALASTREVAGRVGLDATDARVIRDSHNTLVHLPAADVLAKVSTSNLAERGESAIRRELSVGLHLSARKAPAVPPLRHGNGGPHEANGVVLTLWHYYSSEPAPRAPGIELGQALRALHKGLADFPDPLPPVKEKLTRAAALFADPTETPRLTASDRRLAASVYEELQLAQSSFEGKSPLHGEPHADNVLWTGDGPLFVDFEAACTGPIEWDLAFLPEAAHSAFPEADPERLGIHRQAISFCVAAWCWAQFGRAPEVDEAALYHLQVLRQRV